MVKKFSPELNVRQNFMSIFKSGLGLGKACRKASCKLLRCYSHQHCSLSPSVCIWLYIEVQKPSLIPSSCQWPCPIFSPLIFSVISTYFHSFVFRLPPSHLRASKGLDDPKARTNQIYLKLRCHYSKVQPKNLFFHSLSFLHLYHSASPFSLINPLEYPKLFPPSLSITFFGGQQVRSNPVLYGLLIIQ